MRVFKQVRVACTVCGKTWEMYPKDDTFIAVKQNDSSVPQCLWCSWFVEMKQAIYIKELRKCLAK